MTQRATLVDWPLGHFTITLWLYNYIQLINIALRVTRPFIFSPEMAIARTTFFKIKLKLSPALGIQYIQVKIFLN